MTATPDIIEIWWDSERRDSPFSTVCDPHDDGFCEHCDSPVDYSDGSKYGKCNCEEES
jgi:hypothetical protein